MTKFLSLLFFVTVDTRKQGKNTTANMSDNVYINYELLPYGYCHEQEELYQIHIPDLVVYIINLYASEQDIYAKFDQIKRLKGMYIVYTYYSFMHALIIHKTTNKRHRIITIKI